MIARAIKTASRRNCRARIPSEGRQLGFGVSKPWGDSDRFDFILTCRLERLRREMVSVSESSTSRY
jgi:hypothetical protein